MVGIERDYEAELVALRDEVDRLNTQSDNQIRHYDEKWALMNERIEKAEAALAALDAAVSERHLPCEDGIVGGCEVCRALRDAK